MSSLKKVFPRFSVLAPWENSSRVNYRTIDEKCTKRSSVAAILLGLSSVVASTLSNFGNF